MILPGWLIISSFFLYFIILAGLRLDEKLNTNWFVIFIPVWIIALALSILAVLIGCTNSNSNSSNLNANNSSSFGNASDNVKNKKARSKRSKFEDVFWVILVPSKLFVYILVNVNSLLTCIHTGTYNI